MEIFDFLFWTWSSAILLFSFLLSLLSITRSWTFLLTVEMHSFYSLVKTLNSLILINANSEASSTYFWIYKIVCKTMSISKQKDGILHRGQSHLGFAEPAVSYKKFFRSKHSKWAQKCLSRIFSVFKWKENRLMGFSLVFF